MTEPTAPVEDWERIARDALATCERIEANSRTLADLALERDKRIAQLELDRDYALGIIRKFEETVRVQHEALRSFARRSGVKPPPALPEQIAPRLRHWALPKA